MLISKIDELLSGATGELIDLCAEAYSIIMSSDNQVDLFRHLMDSSIEIDSSTEESKYERFTANQRKKLIKQYGELVDGILSAIIEENLSDDEFYSKLWDAIQKTPLLSDENAKIFAIYYIWIDRRIPYFKLDSGLKMDAEEFRSYNDELKNKIRKSLYIINSRFDQKTERASLLLKELESLDTEEEKSVLLTAILQYLVKRTLVTKSSIDD